MYTTAAHHSLEHFRQEVYHRALGQRKDTLFELWEATLVASAPSTLVRLSLVPVFRRRWPSAPAALADGTVDPDQCRALIQARLADLPTDRRPVWALDGTVWPRPAAATSPERTYGHRVNPGIPQSGIVPAWEYQWVVAVPEVRGSWVLPLDLARRGPSAPSPTALALTQLRRALALRPTGAPRPVVTFDSNYDAVALAQAVQATDPAQRLAVDLLVRLNPRRRFFRAPPPYGGRGAPRKHGPLFRLRDPSSHGTPDASARGEDPAHGWVQVDVWLGLHSPRAATTLLTLVRVQVDHLPRSRRTPAPLWLAWAGAALPEDLLDLWRWYARRFAIEHGFRFLKQDLGWTTIRPRHPEAADRWSWLLALAFWELWLARGVVADQRLPWERPLPVERLTPGRVRRAFGGLVAALGSPTRAVRSRGKAPGRRVGECPGPRERHPVVRRRPKRAARRRKRAA